MRQALLQGIRALLRDTRGATAIEYGLICSCIIIAMMAAIINFADTSVAMWDNIADQVDTSN